MSELAELFRYNAWANAILLETAEPSADRAGQALLQVLTHSAQHRSQLAMQLEALGVVVPNFDYITMVGKELSPPA